MRALESRELRSVVGAAALLGLLAASSPTQAFTTFTTSSGGSSTITVSTGTPVVVDIVMTTTDLLTSYTVGIGHVGGVMAGVTNLPAPGTSQTVSPVVNFNSVQPFNGTGLLTAIGTYTIGQVTFSPTIDFAFTINLGTQNGSETGGTS